MELKGVASASGVNPTKMPSGVEQQIAAEEFVIHAEVNPTKMPSGVEQFGALMVSQISD